MKVAVINFSGNVGKTTIARNLLQRKLNCDIFTVETLNSTDETAIKYSASQFSDIQQEMILNDNIIVDIGSSNVEEMIKQFSSYRGSHDDFDYFVIPTVNDKKQINDTIETIIFLVDGLGVSANKIKVIYNRVDSIDNLDSDFFAIKAKLKQLKVKKADSYILETKYFSEIENYILNYDIQDENAREDLTNVDYIAENNQKFLDSSKEFAMKSKSEQDKEKKLEYHAIARQYANLVTLSRLAQSVRDNLDFAYNELFN